MDLHSQAGPQGLAAVWQALITDWATEMLKTSAFPPSSAPLRRQEAQRSVQLRTEKKARSELGKQRDPLHASPLRSRSSTKYPTPRHLLCPDIHQPGPAFLTRFPSRSGPSRGLNI